MSTLWNWLILQTMSWRWGKSTPLWWSLTTTSRTEPKDSNSSSSPQEDLQWVSLKNTFYSSIYFKGFFHFTQPPNVCFLRSPAWIAFSSISTEQTGGVVPPRAAPHSDPGGGAPVPRPQEAPVAPDGTGGQAGVAAQRRHGSHRQRRPHRRHQRHLGRQRNHVRQLPKIHLRHHLHLSQSLDYIF